MKTVYKPWGKEIWLELNDKYCYKRIYINSGHRTSYQYHNKKLETNYIIEGKAEIWLENDEGVVEKTIMTSGDFFTVRPPKKHRVIAITDIILQEVSTPEVDDVVRLSDDAKRSDGRLDYEHMTPALCILAAGVGSRMGEYGKHINKGLLPIDNLAIISHSINKVPKDYEIIIALGYKSNQVKEYCSAIHPDRNIKFIKIEDYTGKKSGPGTSLLACKDHLQRPFYFVTADCLVDEDFPEIGNWLGVHPTSIPEIYSTVKIEDGMISSFVNKSPDGFDYAFIGLCAIRDYEIFWNQLEKNIKDTGEMVCAFYDPKKYPSLEAKTFKWHDIGTIENYLKVHNELENEKLGIPKTSGQFIYKLDGKVTKLFQKNVKNSVERVKNLDKIAPKITYSGENVFSYDWIDGKTLYKRPEKIKEFMKWSYKNLWTKEGVSISSECYKFYKEKTYSRFELFLNKKSNSLNLRERFLINGKECLSIDDYLGMIEWSDICETHITTKLFHGDLQFDNIIVTKSDKFKIIDWRDSFGNQSTYGDVYYDLAKLYGGMMMNYSLVKDPKNYSFVMFDNQVDFSFPGISSEYFSKEDFIDWCQQKGFNFNKIEKLTALIYLNMSPLHDQDLDNILYFNSIKMLSDIYDD